jgi:hypothetical protein
MNWPSAIKAVSWGRLGGLEELPHIHAMGWDLQQIFHKGGDAWDEKGASKGRTSAKGTTAML